MNDADAILKRQYQNLWRSALQSFEQGQVETDDILLDKQTDLRRGMTLIIRPSQEVAERISLFLTELAVAEADQYFYHPNEFHLTLLSLFTATPDYKPLYKKQSAFIGAADQVLSQARPFKIRFRGVTAAPGAVMIQGFPEDDSLNVLRNKLREQLSENGLGDGLDARYPIITAHITVFRFQQQPNKVESFLKCLRQYRLFDFGEMNVSAVQMVENDWYMSRNKVKVIRQWAF